jgi:hypothetical protein
MKVFVVSKLVNPEALGEAVFVPLGVSVDSDEADALVTRLADEEGLPEDYFVIDPVTLYGRVTLVEDDLDAE